MPNNYEIKEPAQSGHYEVYRNNIKVFETIIEDFAKRYVEESKKKDNKIRKLNKGFIISSICREDLIKYVGEEQAIKLNNTQMQNMANKIHNYRMYDYWDDLNNILHDLGIKQINN